MVSKPHSQLGEIGGDAEDGNWAAWLQQKKKNQNSDVACNEKMIYFLWYIVIGIGFAQQSFSCPVGLALCGLLAAVLPRLPWQSFPWENCSCGHDTEEL